MTIDWEKLLVAVLKAALAELEPGGARPSDDKLISELKLSTRSQICLSNEGFRTVGQVREKTDQELLRIVNLGRKGIAEIRETIRALDQ